MAIRHVREAIRHGVSVLEGPPERLNGHELRTRYAIIDPILRGLGWETSNPSHCEVEFRVPGSGERVDYALLVFVAEAPELPGCTAHGDTQEAALEHIGQAIDLWLETAREFGDSIPEPKGERLMLA